MLLGKGLGTLTTRMIAWLEAEIGAIEVVAPRLASQVGKWIADSIPDGFKSVQSFGPTFIAMIGDAIAAARDGIVTLASSIGTWIADAMPEGLARSAADLGAAIVDWVSSINISMADFAAMAQRVGTSIADAVSAALTDAAPLGIKIGAFLNKAFLYASTTISSIIGPISRALVDALDRAVAAFEPQSFALGQRFGQYVADLFGGEGSQTKIFTALTNLVSSAVKFVSGAFMPVVGSLSTALVNWCCLLYTSRCV